ncbi:MAG TPA: phosphoribosylformylglycinamidine synthase subunit PurQ [Bdellovibrionota bacterium]|jgi:phosphoribosylformylglycinamidine synthase
MKNPSVLVLTGDGINCERETARAFSLAGAAPKILHVNDLLENPKQLSQYEALAFPGGFSFGDDLGSGQVLALKISLVLGEELKSFLAAKKPVIGICNGFQALTKLGLLPEPFHPRKMALARNAHGHFTDKWVELEVEKASVCLWTRGLHESGAFALPMRHGEGRIAFLKGEEESIHRQLSHAGQVVLRYSEDVNGSYGRIAGICDPTGLVFGIMPHPEAAVSLLQYPNSTRLEKRDAPGVGLKFFQNCVSYIQERK